MRWLPSEFNPADAASRSKEEIPGDDAELAGHARHEGHGRDAHLCAVDREAALAAAATCDPPEHHAAVNQRDHELCAVADDSAPVMRRCGAGPRRPAPGAVLRHVVSGGCAACSREQDPRGAAPPLPGVGRLAASSLPKGIPRAHARAGRRCVLTRFGNRFRSSA